MADEWWSSPRGHGASACSTAPPTDKASYCWTSTSPTATAAATAESTSSITFQDPHRTPHQPLSDAASSVGDPHMDWAHAFFGRTDTSLQVVLQDDMSAAATPYRPQPSAEETVMSNPFRNTSHSFLLEQAPLASSLQGLLDAAVPMSASHNIPMYGDSYSAMPVMPTLSQLMKSSASDESAQFQGSGAQLQYFSDSNMPFGAPLPSQLLLQALEPKHSCSSRNNSTLVSNSVSVQDACSSATRKSGFESPTVAKRPRIEAPSPLPTFKVRKEKLGDRITALQQLVSPFGKTDTASVLHEAIEYIKFLHEQVASLSTPYLKNGNPFQQLQKKGTEKAKEGGEPKQDLRSRGLCLVPIANTYTVASETAPEFWHPTFEGTFR